MLRQVLQHLNGIDVFGIISTLIFFSFFSLMVWHTMKINKDEDRTLSRIPLDDDRQENNIEKENKKL